jgi:putative peptidoglycan lipid II flippase
MGRAAMLFACGTVGVKMATFVKEAVVGAAFGVSGAMDAYLMGMMLICVPMGLLLNAVQTAFIPQFVEVREQQGTRSSAVFLQATATGTLLTMAIVLLIWLAMLPWTIDIVGHGFDPAKRHVVRVIFLWLVPYYFLNGLNLVGHGALQADKRFLPSALIPVCTTLVTITIVLGAGGNVYALALSMVIGSVLESAALQWQLRRAGVSLWPGRISLSPEILRIAKGSAVLLGGSFVIAFSPMIEQGLASGLGKGTVAAMGYAFKLPAMLSSVLVTAVGVTVLPFFSEMLARQDHDRCQLAFRRYALALLTGGGLLVLLLGALSEPIVTLVYQRGAFHAQDTQLVAQVQRAYLIQIPGALVGILAMRLVVAQGAYRVVAVINCFSVVVAGTFAWALSRKMGPVGIALGLSIAVTSFAVVWFFMALRTFAKNHRIERS